MHLIALSAPESTFGTRVHLLHLSAPSAPKCTFYTSLRFLHLSAPFAPNCTFCTCLHLSASSAPECTLCTRVQLLHPIDILHLLLTKKRMIHRKSANISHLVDNNNMVGLGFYLIVCYCLLLLLLSFFPTTVGCRFILLLIFRMIPIFRLLTIKTNFESGLIACFFVHQL